MKNVVFKLGQLLALVTGLGAMGVAAEDAPPTPGVVDAYFCTYQPGKDRDDLLAARDNLVKVAARADFALNNAFVWHAFKGGAPVDFIWMSVHESLEAYGTATQTIEDSAALSAAVARFDTVAECRSNLGSARVVREGKPLPAGEGALVSSNLCKAKGAVSSGDVNDLRGHINAVLDGSKSFEQVSVYSIVPMTGDANSPDVVLFSVHDSVAGWARRSTELASSAAGQSLRRHFDAMLECASSLWHSEQVVSAQ